MKIMFSAGETSGDMHGANLARALKELSPNVKLFGFGGPQMRSAGVHLVRNMLDYSVMGFWEVLINLRRMFKLKAALVEEMKRERPDLLVIIDYPDFNWRLAAEAKKLHIPVFSYIPPSAWAWRKGRAVKAAAVADKIVAIFPFETKVYEQAGANISFVGNPLLDNVHASMDKADAYRYFGIKPDNDNIMLLPGSRRQEIDKMLDPMLEAAVLISSSHPQARFYLPVAPGLDEDDIMRRINASGALVKICRGKTYDLMNCCDFAIATSGTVTLEAALMNLPSVVLYKMSSFTYRIAKLFVHVEFFSLPNILAGKAVLPELLQDEVNADAIAKRAEELFKGTKTAQAVKAELAEIKGKLGSPGVAERTAKLILQTADKFKIKDR